MFPELAEALTAIVEALDAMARGDSTLTAQCAARAKDAHARLMHMTMPGSVYDTTLVIHHRSPDAPYSGPPGRDGPPA